MKPGVILFLPFSHNDLFLSLGVGILGAALGAVLAYLVLQIYCGREYPQGGGSRFAPLAVWRGDILAGMASGWVCLAALGLLLTTVTAETRLSVLHSALFWPILAGGLILTMLLLAVRLYSTYLRRGDPKSIAQQLTSPEQLFTVPASGLLLAAGALPFLLMFVLRLASLMTHLIFALLVVISAAGSYLILLLLLVSGWFLEQSPLPLLTLPFWLGWLYPIAGQTYRKTRWARGLADPKEFPRLLDTFGADIQLNRDLRIALRRLVTHYSLPVDNVLEALHDKRPAVRSNISETLISLASEQVVIPLLALLADPDLQVRSSAMSALARLGIPHGVPPVLCLLGSALHRGLSSQATVLVCTALPLIRDGEFLSALTLLEQALVFTPGNTTSKERLIQALDQLATALSPKSSS